MNVYFIHDTIEKRRTEGRISFDNYLAAHDLLDDARRTRSLTADMPVIYALLAEAESTY